MRGHVRGHISTVMVVSEGEGGAIKKYLRCRSSGASIEGRKVPTARDIILLLHAQKRKATLQVVLPAGPFKGAMMGSRFRLDFGCTYADLCHEGLFLKH